MVLLLAVMLIQCAAVTLVPVIHPLLHRVSYTGVIVTFTPVTDDELDASLDGSCFACHVSAASLGSPPTFLERASIHGRQATLRPADRQAPVHQFVPANPVRAPPTL